MTQIKIQSYMERHKLGPLFEDLMNRVLRDMPEEPIIYLLRTLYKKSGIEIPQEIRYGGLRKSVEFGRSQSPDKSTKTEHATTSTSIAHSADAPLGRDYDKPWLSHSRRFKPRQSAEPDITKTSKKSKLEWLNEKGMTSFDELYQDQEEMKKESSTNIRRSRAPADTHSSWAAVGDDGKISTSLDYRRQHHQNETSEEDLLAAEIVRHSFRDADASQSTGGNTATVPKRRQKLEGIHHREQLQQLLHSEATVSTPIPDDHLDDLEDENQSAIELLENAEDLEREGVKNIPKSGYKLSKILRERLNEPLVKLNIKFDPHTAIEYNKALNKMMMKGYESDQENTSPGGQNDSEDEEFESVSQVTGPRRPVWQVPESDGDSSSPNGVRPQQRHEKHRHNKRLASSVPGRFHGIPLNVVTSDPRDSGFRGNQTWAPGHHRGELGSLTDAAQDLGSSEQEVEAEGSSTARSGGWVLPEDSDAASIHDWNQRVKGKKRDPRAY